MSDTPRTDAILPIGSGGDNRVQHVALELAGLSRLLERENARLRAECERLREENSGHVLALRRLHNELHMTRMENGTAQNRLLTEIDRLREALRKRSILHGEHSLYCNVCEQRSDSFDTERHAPGCLASKGEDK